MLDKPEPHGGYRFRYLFTQANGMWPFWCTSKKQQVWGFYFQLLPDLVPMKWRPSTCLPSPPAPAEAPVCEGVEGRTHAARLGRPQADATASG